MATAKPARMSNTTSPTSTFESIDLAALTDVQGGCGKKRCCCAPQAQAIAIAAPAPAPAPLAPPPAPAPSVETSVSVSYQ